MARRDASVQPVIRAFSGDRFLAMRAARAALREAGHAVDDVVEFGEGLDVDAVAQAARQGGLFASAVLLLDFDAAFTGQAGTKARNALMKELERVPEEADVFVVDAAATAPRQKTWRALGTLLHQPTPRFRELRTWIAAELKANGVRTERGVPEVLADLFGEDLPGLAAEISKLAVLDEVLDEDRVTYLVHRPAARGAFDMIDAIVAGDTATAIRTARLLLDAGEAPARILGALGWQVTLIARAVALIEAEGEVPDAVAAGSLRVARFPAGKAMRIARGLQEADLAALLARLLDVEVGMKTGRREGRWSIEYAALALSSDLANVRR